MPAKSRAGSGGKDEGRVGDWNWISDNFQEDGSMAKEGEGSDYSDGGPAVTVIIGNEKLI
jgi:hypothetical protein